MRSCSVKKQSQVYQDGQWQKLQPEDRLKLTLHEAQVSHLTKTSSTHNLNGQTVILMSCYWTCMQGLLAGA